MRNKYDEDEEEDDFFDTEAELPMGSMKKNVSTGVPIKTNKLSSN